MSHSYAQNAASKGLGGRLLTIIMVAAFLFLILPILIVVPLSFNQSAYLSFPPQGISLRWYKEALGDGRWLRAGYNSLLIGLPTAILSALLGTLTALSAAHVRTRWMRLASAVVVMPMMLPHIVLAIGIYPVIVKLGLSGTLIAPIIGHTVIGIPLVFITVTAALKDYDFRLELAAMTLGATQLEAFRRVTLRMIFPSVASGAVLAFVLSFDELILSLFLTSPRTETLPRLIWDQLAYALSPTIAAVASVIFALSLVLLASFVSLRNLGKIKQSSQ